MLGIGKNKGRLEIIGNSHEWEQFRAAVLFVAGACSKDKNLPAFTCIALEVMDGETMAGLVSTDRFRLHAVSLRGDFEQFKQNTPADRYLIDGAKLAAAVKPKRSNAFNFAIEGGSWSLSVEDSVVMSDLIKADFPDFRKVWPVVDESAAPKNFNMSPNILGGTLAAIDRAYPGDKATRLSFSGNELRPIILDKFNEYARALVMPCRVI